MSNAAADLNKAVNQSMEAAEGTFVFSRILHLGVMCTDLADNCDDLEEFASDLDNTVVRDLLPALPELERMSSVLDNGDEDDVLSELLYILSTSDHFGFLCRIEAPRVTITERGSKLVSMGVRSIRWFYGETLQGIIDQADAWARSLEKREGAAV